MNFRITMKLEIHKIEIFKKKIKEILVHYECGYN